MWYLMFKFSHQIIKVVMQSGVIKRVYGTDLQNTYL